MSNILGNMPPVFGSGYRGVVPAPTAADVSAQNILRADGTWGAQATSGPLPSQTGNAGELLTTDGTNASWTPSLNDFSISNLTFGVGGPNARSSIAARAARQGLVFDGTNTSGATVTGVPALGTGDFTIGAWVKCSNFATIPLIIGATGGDVQLYFNTSGIATIAVVGQYTSTPSAVELGKTALVVATRQSGTTTVYLNGVAGTPNAASTGNITGLINTIGGQYGFASAPFTGFISPIIENRALTAAEVVSLYEAGVPSGADYATPAATNTALNASTVVLAGSGGSLSGASATGFAATYSAGSYAYVNTQPTFTATASTSFAVSFTASGVSGRVDARLRGSTTVGGAITVANGTNTAVLTGASGTVYLEFYNALLTASGVTVSSLVVKPLGLLLAPDAAQAGGGLTWYDTSGNAANITLPASGVTWNVPTSGNVTSGGALNLRAGGTNQNITLTPSGSGLVEVNNAGTGMALKVFRSSQMSSSTDYLLGIGDDASNGRSLYLGMVRDSGGSYYGKLNVYGDTVPISIGGSAVLLGTTTNSANGKLQLASHTTSAGGIGFGTDTTLFRSSAGILSIGDGTSTRGLIINGAAANAQVLLFQQAGTEVARIGLSASTSLVLATGANVTALTLDSSQNATFAGKVTVSGGNIISGSNWFQASNNAGLLSNLYFSSGWKYVGNGAGAAIYADSSNGAIFATAAVNSGGAGAAATLTTALTIDGSQNATFAGQINGNAGFRFRGATGTFYELLRYVGGSNNPGLYVRATEATSTIRLDVSGSSGPFPFEIASGGTLAATFTGADAKLYGKINAASLPTSSAGLSAGDLWVDTAAGNVIKRV